MYILDSISIKQTRIKYILNIRSNKIYLHSDIKIK